MAKVIVKFRYYKPKTFNNIGNYAFYIATREGVEKCDDSNKFKEPSDKQMNLIEKLITQFPDSVMMPEYEDYMARKCAGTASDFISRVIEDNPQNKTYADYIATRPGVEKDGKHGLFGNEGEVIQLSKISEELNQHKGNIWTMIVSLRREDAERLNYNTGEAWRSLMRGHVQELADSLKIPFEELKWYGAFHNESTHPHIHVIAYTDNPNVGYLSQYGIDKMRKTFAETIFADENLYSYEKQTETRNKLKKNWKVMLQNILKQMGKRNLSIHELENSLLELAVRLGRTSGKKQYGYLKKDVKNLIDSIVDMLAEDENIAKLYDMWWDAKCEILKNYSSTVPDKILLSKNKEFASLKNDIIREAMRIYIENEKEFRNLPRKIPKDNWQNYNKSPIITANAVTRLFNSLANIFRNNIENQYKKNHPSLLVDKRKQKEIDAKKNAEVSLY